MTPTTSLGFSATEFSDDPLGISPFPWQRFLLIHGLELRRDGRFRFRTVLVLVARQNGKTTVVEVKNLWKMFVLRVPLVIGTAQKLDIAEESWDRAVEIVESIPELAAELAHIDRTNGKKALKLTNQQGDRRSTSGGPRWKIEPASRRGGRGLAGDDVNLDELREHQNWLSWAAVSKTTMARPNAQVWAYSNAGDDKSIVLNELLAQARAAAEHPETGDSSLGLFEWSAPDDVKCTCRMRPHDKNCRLQDRSAWAQANPSLGYTITEAALASALATDPEEVFRTECLCQSVASLSDWSVFSKPDWSACQDKDSAIAGQFAFAIEASHDLAWLSVGAAGRGLDGQRHLEPVARFPADTGRMVGWLKKRLGDAEKRPAAVAIDPAGPAAYLIPEIEKHCEIEVVKPLGRELAAACASVYVGISGEPEARNVRVRTTTPELSDALTAAARAVVWRERGDAKVFDRRVEETADVAPIIAVTLADYVFGQLPDDYDALDSVR